jgi:hypothetical protein
MSKPVVFAVVVTAAVTASTMLLLRHFYDIDEIILVEVEIGSNDTVNVTEKIDGDGGFADGNSYELNVQVATEALIETTKKCYRMAPWGDVCVTENVCWDGSLWYVLHPTKPTTVTSENMNFTADDLVSTLSMPVFH